MKALSRHSLTWSCCLTLAVLSVSAALLVGRDDPTGTTPRAQDPAVLPVGTDPARDVILVLRPDGGTGGTASRPDAKPDIWQATLAYLADKRTPVDWQAAAARACGQDGRDVGDHEAEMSLVDLCAAADELARSNTKPVTGPIAELAPEIDQLVCSDALCARFETTRAADDNAKSFPQEGSVVEDGARSIAH